MLRCFARAIVIVTLMLQSWSLWAEPTSSNGGEGADNSVASTVDFTVSPFKLTVVSINDGLMTTTEGLAATSTQVGVVMVFILIGLVVVAALGVGVYFIVKALRPKKKPLSYFLRDNRVPLARDIGIGGGPLINDLSVLYGLQERQRSLGRELRADHRAGLKRVGEPEAFNRWVLSTIAKTPSLLTYLFASDRWSIEIGWERGDVVDL